MQPTAIASRHCTTCVENGTKSRLRRGRVTTQPAARATLAVVPWAGDPVDFDGAPPETMTVKRTSSRVDVFWDEATGAKHVHDSRSTITTYTCSLGHEYAETSFPPGCAVAGCVWSP